MKYISSNTKQVYDISFESRKYRIVCPECSQHRKKSTAKDCEYFPDTNSAYCHHCATSYHVYDPHIKQKEYTVPEWKNKTDLTEGAVRYLNGRMISQETLIKMKVYSDTEYMPQYESNQGVICFPYFINNKLVNIKYRTKEKKFKLVSGAELVFYNYDAILNYNEIIIVEGEIDALTFVENGFDNVVSVPNGGQAKNMEYLDSCIEAFNKVERIYLATDQDSVGLNLRDELARRLGFERCFIVSFKELKDANEYFCKYGMEFKDVIKDARPYPIEGIINISDIYGDISVLFEEGVKPGLKIEQLEIDQYITWETRRLAIVTGIPGSGKSEFVDYLVSKLNLYHGWKAAYFTPENYPLKYHYMKLYEKFIGKKFSSRVSSDTEFDSAYEYIQNNFFYIMPEDNFTVETIINAAKSLIKSKGIKILVIDPYNKIEHKYTDSETQYISRFLDLITSFAKMNDVLVFLIAHPRKMNKDGHGKYEVPTLYDISGSANFYNKCDYGFTVHRKTNDKNIMSNEILVYWQKIKFKHLGEQGISDLMYNYNNGRFEKEQDVKVWDNSNWLSKQDIEASFWDTNNFDNEQPPF